MMIMVETVKINLNKTDSKLVKSNETYDVIDSTNLLLNVGGVAIRKDRMDVPYWILRHKTGASPSQTEIYIIKMMK